MSDNDMRSLDAFAKLEEMLKPGAMVEIDAIDNSSINHYGITVRDSHRLSSRVFGLGKTLEEAIDNTYTLCESAARDDVY